MAVASSDVLLKYSTTAGSAGNSNTGTASGSLGKYVSTTQPTDNSLNNWFDNISAAENAASTVDYRCLFIHNNHATDSWTSVKVWLSSEVSGGASIAISLDTTGVTAKGSASAQAKTIANETTAPASQTFSSPTTEGTALSIGTIAAGSVQAIWIRRTAANSVAKSNDGVTLSFKGI